MSPMKSLDQALRGAISQRQSDSGVPLGSVLSEQASLLALGRALLKAARLEGLVPSLYSAVRSSPARGLRGSELTLRMRHASATARVRIQLAVLQRLAPELGSAYGIQSVAVKLAKAHTEGLAARTPQARPQIPAAARQRLLAALEAQDH